jgi:predicted ATPase/DNA-binding SARP family transcriptional activator
MVIAARVPAPLTPLVGRDGRVEEAARLLSTTRLFTLTGAGGSGKTRLAIEVAAGAAPAAWVELASLEDPRLLSEHVASALGVADRAGKPSMAQLVEWLRERTLLLALDNCEHVIDAAAGLASELLRRCPGVRILATSREALGVAGERTWTVPPLSLPREDDGFEKISASDAVTLFVDRAQAVRSSFTLTTRNAPAIARICRRLDGIPLAIELAAARVRTLDPEQLAERLESSVGLLETGSRAALPRHRTLRETIDWSYRLLTGEERSLLTRLSVFHGSFALDAVEEVCAERSAVSASTLDLLTGLFDKSLVLHEPDDSGARYRLLETVREYAREQLDASGETDAIRERHARFFAALAERAAPAIFGGAGDERWMIRLDAEATNLRDAHDWCEQQTSRLELSLRFAIALHWYWFARGRFTEGRLRVGVALTFAEGIDPVLRGRALTVMGYLVVWQGDYGDVRTPMSEAVTLLRGSGDKAALAYALNGLGIAEGLGGRITEARARFDEAERTLAGEPPGIVAAHTEYWRGLAAQWDGDWAGARARFESALAIGRRLAHQPAIGHALCVLGRLAASRGEIAEARAALGQSLEIFRNIEDRWGLVHALHGLASVETSEGRAASAASLLGAAEALREELSIDLSPPDRAFYDATVAAAIQQVAEPAFWGAWSAGRKAPFGAAVATVLRSEAPPRVNGRTASSVPAPDLRVHALGVLEAWVADRRVEKGEWGSSRARELLVFLLCHPNGCSKPQVGLALWPDASPAQLRNSFHVTLHRLRQALGRTDAIVSERDVYRVNPALSTEFDAVLFEREARDAVLELRGGRDARGALARAIARYRGEFLAQESVGEWAEEWRERLKQLHAEALEALGRAHMERERYTDAVDAFRALLASDPVNEDACRRQMTCLAHLGDRGAALRTYDALVSSLRAELDVAPERETTALRDRLRAASSV